MDNIHNIDNIGNIDNIDNIDNIGNIDNIDNIEAGLIFLKKYPTLFVSELGLVKDPQFEIYRILKAHRQLQL